MAELFGISMEAISLVRDASKVAIAIYRTVESAQNIDGECGNMVSKMADGVRILQSYLAILDNLKGRYLGEGILDEV